MSRIRLFFHNLTLNDFSQTRKCPIHLLVKIHRFAPQSVSIRQQVYIKHNYHAAFTGCVHCTRVLHDIHILYSLKAVCSDLVKFVLFQPTRRWWWEECALNVRSRKSNRSNASCHTYKKTTLKSTPRCSNSTRADSDQVTDTCYIP